MRRFLFVIICIGIILSTFASPVSAYYTNMNASVVVGQPNFTSNGDNQGTGSPLANTLSNPIGAFSDGVRLFVADIGNNRVLIWNKIPTNNNTPADIVLGQPDMTSSTANNGGISCATLNAPSSVWFDGTHLVVGESNGNRRALIWNSLPTRNMQPADVVVGQVDCTTVSISRTQNKITNATDAIIANNKLFISDSNNRRVLIWNTIPTTNGANADVVAGEDDFTSVSTAGGANHFFTGPRFMWVYNNKLIVNEISGGNRVLVWNSVPTSNGTSADVVLGQPNFSGSTADNGGVSCSTLNGPDGVTTTPDGRLIIGDTSRVLIWNSIPGTNFAPADLILGQPDCVTRTSNFGGLSASSISSTTRTSVYGNKLIVTDSGNHRVLIFNNTVATPNINLTNSPTSIGSGRYRLPGNVFMNNNGGTYGLQTLQADLNGVGYGQISFPSGRNDGGGNSIYDFTYDFDPTVGLGSINNLTIKLLASTFNADTNTLFYFLPFNFQSFNVANTKSQSFTFSVNKNQLSRIKDNLDHFEIWYTKNTTTPKWTQYIPNISKAQLDTNGLVSYNKTTNNTKFIGSYIFKITAIDNWGNKEESNNLYIAGTNTITLSSTFNKNFLPLPSVTPISLPTMVTLPTITPTEEPTIVNNSASTPIKSITSYLIFGIGIGVALIFLLILWKRRKKE